MKPYLSIIFIFVFSFIVFGQDLPESATFTVTNLNDSGAGSLRQAINDASLVAGDDTINFQSDLSGAIALTSGELLINSNVAINGNASITITTSTTAGTPNFRILKVAPGATVSINFLIISGGKVTDADSQGGGIYNAGNLSLTATTVSDNVINAATSKGGGIYNSGVLSLTNSNLNNNSARCVSPCSGGSGFYSASGGGIYNTGTATFNSNNINGNIIGCDNNSCGGAISQAEGGGITNTGTITITNSTVSNNQSLGSTCSLSCNGSSKGGGVFNSDTGTANILNSTVGSNLASGTKSYGGGIYNSNTLSVTNTSVISNSAIVSGGSQSLSGGGGIFSAKQLIVTNSTVSNNKSAASNQQYGAKGGSGIYGGGTITLRNSTVSGNSHQCYSCNSTYDYDQQGGAIAGGLFTISNTIVASNTFFGINSPFDVTGRVNSEGYNLIGKVGTSSGWLNTDILNRDAKLAPLADNGGPTQTQALLPDSPAINAGNNADAPATDQRGFARIVGGIIDIGAFESATTCDFTINPTNQFISSFGGNITVNVTGAASCSRTAVSTLEWISVTSGSSGSGTGTVTLSIQANTGLARTGTVTIAGQTFTVNQSSGCTFSLSSASSALIPGAGGGGTFDIQSGAGCAYTASTTDTWITIDGSVSGTGSGTISYTVAANTGAARTGTITVGGQTFTVNQAAVKSRKRVRFI